MINKIKNFLQNTFVLSFSYTFTALIIILQIANNGNILTDLREREYFKKKRFVTLQNDKK